MILTGSMLYIQFELYNGAGLHGSKKTLFPCLVGPLITAFMLKTAIFWRFFASGCFESEWSHPILIGHLLGGYSQSVDLPWAPVGGVLVEIYVF